MLKAIERATRVVRVYGIDLAIGDVLIDVNGEYIGTVDSVPVWDTETGKMLFSMLGPDGGHVAKKLADNRPVQVKLARRTA